MSYARITIRGNIGKPPVLQQKPDGDKASFCNFTVAVNNPNRRTRSREPEAGVSEDQQSKLQPTWYSVTLWGRLAEIACQYAFQGKPVLVDGRLRVNEWVDRDGRSRYTLEIHNVTDFELLGESIFGVSERFERSLEKPDIKSEEEAPVL